MTTADVTLHLITDATAGLLERVADDVFDHALQPALLRAFLANPANLLFVAVAEGEVIGMASGIAYVHPDKPLQLFINEVGVSSRFRRQGIGKMLVEALLGHARSIGCREAWVGTEVGNAPARALYSVTGGEVDSDLMAVYFYRLED